MSAPRAASTESGYGAAYREAAWKVQISARFCADPARAARLRSLAALHEQHADRLEGRAVDRRRSTWR